MSRALRSTIDRRDATFVANTEAMVSALDEIRELVARVTTGGGSEDATKNARTLARHRARGKLLPRERIALLLDRASPFLELSPLAGWGTEDPLGGGMVTGIGTVSGVECMIVANDPTVKGGSQGPT